VRGIAVISRVLLPLSKITCGIRARTIVFTFAVCLVYTIRADVKETFGVGERIWAKNDGAA